MSWSFNRVGTTDQLAINLDDYGSQLSGPSKEEFDAALPHLKAIIAQNFYKAVEMGIAQGEQPETYVRIDAHGHGWHKDGKQVANSVTCNIKPVSKMEAEGK